MKHIIIWKMSDRIFFVYQVGISCFTSVGHIIRRSDAKQQLQARLWAWGRGDQSTPSLAATLTLLQPGGADYAHQILMSPPNFESHKRAWILSNYFCRNIYSGVQISWQRVFWAGNQGIHKNSSWKLVNIYKLARMCQNFDYYPGFQPKIPFTNCKCYTTVSAFITYILSNTFCH